MGMGTDLREVLGGHLRENAIEVPLVSFVHQSVMEHPLALMAEETENLVVFTDHTRICLKYTWNEVRHS